CAVLIPDEIVDGRLVFIIDQPIGNQARRIRIIEQAEEGKLLPVPFSMILPQAQQSLLKESGATKLDSVEEEMIDGKLAYWVDQTIEGKRVRFHVDATDGTLLSKDQTDKPAETR